MAEKYYRVDFTAQLQKLTLAFKMSCEIQIFWKRGEKIAQTGRVPFRDCIANFNQSLTISCNVSFNPKQKRFKEKQTKFAIVLYTEKGNKQAGQICFDVAPFLNERNKQKDYEMNLNKCPDKNAILAFKLKASIIEEKAYDTISQSSLVSVDIQNLTNNPPKDNEVSNSSNPAALNKGSTTSIMLKKKQIGDLSNATISSSEQIPEKQSRSQIPQTLGSSRSNVSGKGQQSGKVNSVTTVKSDIKKMNMSSYSVQQKIKALRKEKEQFVKEISKQKDYTKENAEYKRKLKDDEYQSCKEIKKKLEAGKKEIENLQKEIRKQKKIKDEMKVIEANILKSKQQLMTIFNEADKYGPQALDLIQKACGLQQY